MKLVVFSDVHLDWTTGGLERFDEVSAAMNQVEQTAIEEQADRVIFLGDLCDPDLDTSLAHRSVARMVQCARTLDEQNIGFEAIVGNHDVVEDGLGSHTMMAVARAGFEVFSEPAVRVFEDVGFVFLPYPSLTKKYDPAEFMKRSMPGVRARVRRFVVCGHLTIPSIDPGSEVLDMPRGRDVFYPFEEASRLKDVVILGGHYHRQQVTREGIRIPGSLARLTHGEEKNEPSFLVLEV